MLAVPRRTSPATARETGRYRRAYLAAIIFPIGGGEVERGKAREVKRGVLGYLAGHVFETGEVERG